MIFGWIYVLVFIVPLSAIQMHNIDCTRPGEDSPALPLHAISAGMEWAGIGPGYHQLNREHEDRSDIQVL